MSDLNTLLLEAAKEGRADELACGLIAMSVTASLLFLRGQAAVDGTAEPKHQERAVFEALLVKEKAFQFGQVAAAKLMPNADADTARSFAGSVACAIVADVALHLVTLGCGGPPRASAGMVGMASHALLKDLIPIDTPRGEAGGGGGGA